MLPFVVPSISFDSLDEMVGWSEDEFVNDIMKQHYKNATFILAAADGDTAFRPGSGVFAGGSIATNIAINRYSAPLHDWIDNFDEGSKKYLCTTSILDCEKTINLSVSAFVDDLCRRTILKTNNTQDILKAEQVITQGLSDSIAVIGVEQNMDKAVTQITTTGPGTVEVYRNFYGFDGYLSSSGYATDARYLGPYLHFRFSIFAMFQKMGIFRLILKQF